MEHERPSENEARPVIEVGATVSRPAAPRLIMGVAIIVFGVLLTLDHLGVMDIGQWWEWWPVLLIALGLAKLAQPRGCQGRGWGAIMLVVGTWVLLYDLGVIDISLGQGWPVLLVLLGASMVWRTLVGARPPRLSRADGDSTVAISSVFGGSKQGSGSQAFRGGTVAAVFGACELDLRQAAIAGEEAVLDVSAVFGGVDIRVPDGWNVVLRATSVLGAVEDKTVHREGSAGPRFVVTGSAVFGGIDVGN